MDKQNLVDPAVYDMATLVKWYIDLRNNKSEIKRSIEPSLAHIDAQMEMIEAEMNKRIVESGTKSMRTENGTVSRVQKTKYIVSDPHAFRQWVLANPAQGINLMNTAVTQGEVKLFLEDGNTLPDGLAVDASFDISVRRT